MRYWTDRQELGGALARVELKLALPYVDCGGKAMYAIPFESGLDWERLLVGESREMRQVAHLIRMVGPRRATVLITGETGSGKEVAAKALHLAGPRRRSALV